MYNPGEILINQKEKYRVQQLLGQGNFTAFYRGVRDRDHLPIFIKEYTDPTPLIKKQWKHFIRHQTLVLGRLRTLSLSFVEECFDDFVFKNHYVQIKGFYDGQTLEEYIPLIKDSWSVCRVMAAASRCLALIHQGR